MFKFSFRYEFNYLNLLKENFLKLLTNLKIILRTFSTVSSPLAAIRAFPSANMFAYREYS